MAMVEMLNQFTSSCLNYVHGVHSHDNPPEHQKTTSLRVLGDALSGVSSLCFGKMLKLP